MGWEHHSDCLWLNRIQGSYLYLIWCFETRRYLQRWQRCPLKGWLRRRKCWDACLFSGMWMENWADCSKRSSSFPGSEALSRATFLLYTRSTRIKIHFIRWEPADLRDVSTCKNCQVSPFYDFLGDLSRSQGVKNCQTHVVRF